MTFEPTERERALQLRLDQTQTALRDAERVALDRDGACLEGDFDGVDGSTWAAMDRALRERENKGVNNNGR